MGQMLTQQLDVALRAGIAVVGMMEEEFDAVEHDAKAGAMTAFDRGAEVMKERFHLAPMDVGADRVGKYGMQQMSVFVTHDALRSSKRDR